MYSSPRANVTSLDQVPLVMIACGVFVTTVGANAAVARLPLTGRTVMMSVVADTVGTYPVVGSATDAGYSHLPVVAVGAYLVVDSAAFLGTTFGPVTTDGANSAVTSVAVGGVTLTSAMVYARVKRPEAEIVMVSELPSKAVTSAGAESSRQ